MAEYRRQIAAGGFAAIVIAFSIAIALLYIPNLNLNGSNNTSASTVTSAISTTSGSTVTIYVYKTVTTNPGSVSTSAGLSFSTKIVTVTVTKNGSTTTHFDTVTASSNTGCPPYLGSGIPLNCVPVLISNSQTSPISTGTQMMIRADWQSFSSYLAPNVGNVVFADASGNPLYAWCESSCANTQSVSNVWIKDDGNVAGYGQQEMFMYIFPTSQIQYSSLGYWGAFPIITATYGQYDNGPKVFDFYNNFNGTTLCGCLTAVPFLGNNSPGGTASYSISNGLTITATGSPSGARYGYHVYLNTPESYTAIDSNIVATDLPANVTAGSAYRYNAMDLMPPATSYAYDGFYSSYSSLDLLCSCGNSFSIHLIRSSGANGSAIASGAFQPFIGVQSFVWPATGSQFANYMENQQLRGTDSSLVFAPTYADIAFMNGLSSQHYVTYHWMRTRNAPPNNVMPSASFGTIIAYQP